MPPGGATVIGGSEGMAGAEMSVNLATGHMVSTDYASAGWKVTETADIGASIFNPAPIVIPVIIVTTKWFPEHIQAFFGPGAVGSMDFELSAVDETTDTTLFDSTTVLSNTSGAVVTDNTGSLTWEQNPGYFVGLDDQGDMAGAGGYSENAWDLQPFTLQGTDNIGAGDTDDIDVTMSWSADVSGGSVGLGAAVPEPASLALVAVGAMGLMMRVRRSSK